MQTDIQSSAGGVDCRYFPTMQHYTETELKWGSNCCSPDISVCRLVSCYTTSFWSWLNCDVLCLSWAATGHIHRSCTWRVTLLFHWSSSFSFTHLVTVQQYFEWWTNMRPDLQAIFYSWCSVQISSTFNVFESVTYSLKLCRPASLCSLQHI